MLAPNSAAQKFTAIATPDTAHVQTLLAAHRAESKRALIATDGVFSPRIGDLAPLAELSRVSPSASLTPLALSDDAHGLGVVGGGLRLDICLEAAPKVPLQMGTLSKAVGGYGWLFVRLRKPVIDLIRTRARTFIYSTTACHRRSSPRCDCLLEVIGAETGYVAEPLRKARQFTRALNLPESARAPR